MSQRKLAPIFLLIFVLEGWLLSSSLLAVGSAASLYKDVCATCHGVSGKGDGSAGAALNPKPADHTNCKRMGADSNETLFKIIKDGSQSVGRSSMMPSWGGALSDQQIRELVMYVRSLCKK